MAYHTMLNELNNILLLKVCTFLFFFVKDDDKMLLSIYMLTVDHNFEKRKIFESRYRTLLSF